MAPSLNILIGLPLLFSSLSIIAKRLWGSIGSLCYHLHTIYLFSCNNIQDTIIPGLLFGSLNASVAPRLSMGPARSLTDILQSIPAMLLWGWSHLLFFNISNQRHECAITEDRLNKPWRPLATNRVSPGQASWALCLMCPVIMIIWLSLGGLAPGCIIVALTLLYNDCGGASNPWVKNLLNGPAIVSFHVGPLEVATGRSIFPAAGNGEATAWLLILAAAVATTSHAQDFRDVDGDKAAGRETLLISIGDLNARMLAAFGIAGWTLVACRFWGVGWAGGSLVVIAGVVVAGNMFWDKTRAGDALTWKIFPFWMLGLFLLPVWVDMMSAY